MTTKIKKKIRACEVVQPDTGDVLESAGKTAPAKGKGRSESAEVIQMHESVARPETLVGATYKIKSPLFEHALYVTINDIVLNAGTEHEQRRPFEIFINSKSMDHFQWIVALTRIMSAVFRKGGDVTFLVEEMKAVFDPRGGYFKSGGVYMPSIVAEIGAVLEQHMRTIGMLHDPEMTDAQRQLIAEKRAAFEKARINKDTDHDTTPNDDDEVSASGFPPGAAQCSKCNTQALVLLDGCQTCLNCGYSKCG
ncbi:MAG: NrdJb [Rhodanobacteraceae bacterium]